MNISIYQHQGVYNFEIVNLCITGVRAGGGGTAPLPKILSNSDFMGSKKIWAKPFFKDVSVRFFISLKRNIFYLNLKKS